MEAARFPDRPAACLYLPEASAAPPAPDGEIALRFGTYDVRTGAVQRLRVELPRSGPARALVMETPHSGAEVRAPRAAG